jgi:hypothetical protein
VTQILLSDVDAANPITVIGPATLGATKDAPLDLASYIQAVWAGPRGVVFILQSHLHPQSFGFVGELVADAAMGPLVNFLVVGMPNIGILSEVSNVADDHRLHASLLQRGDKVGGLLMFEVLDLMFKLFRLLLLWRRPLVCRLLWLHIPFPSSE